MKVVLGIFSPTLLQIVRLMMVMMIARVMSWGLVVLLNHGAGALWVGLNIIFALTLLLSLQGCQSLTSPFSFLGGLFLLDYFLDYVVVAMVVKVGVLIMMNTHMYSWDGKAYLQQAGGPIGLRSTCCIARLVMVW